MKFSFLKFKKDKTPSLSFLRPPIFNVRKSWSLILGLLVLIFLITAIVGAKLFYIGYFETYKKQKTENYDNAINVKRLKTIIEKRNSFIKTDAALPRDPSL